MTLNYTLYYSLHPNFEVIMNVTDFNRLIKKRGFILY